MNERYQPNPFKRLAQGSEARAERIAALNPVTTSAVKEVSRNKFHERAGTLAAVSLTLAVLAACARVGANDGQTFGDVNCDANVNSIDAALVLQKTAGLIDTLVCKDAGDVNGDNRLNAIDAALILQFDARLINNLPVESIRKELPTIEILDETFRGSELLADNLIRPQDIAVNPANGLIYYVAKTNSGGASEYIYDLVNKDVNRRFRGAGDPWGAIQQTEIAINKNGELFVYSRTWIDDNIRVYDTKTGEIIIEIEDPFPDSFRPNGSSRYQPVRSVAANPVDNKFYMSVFSDGPIISFDPETGSLERHTPKNVSWRYSMCFDFSGTAYLGDVLNEYLDEIPNGGDGQRFEFENLREVVESIIGDYEEFNIDGLSYDNSANRLLMHGYAITKDYVERGGTIYLPNIILAVDPASHIVSPVAVLSSDSPLHIEGIDVDNEGNIYFTTSTNALPYSEDNGKVFKLIKN